MLLAQITIPLIFGFFILTKHILDNVLISDKPPICKHVETSLDINQEAFTNHTWYSQYQQEVMYQNRSSFYCVTATYNLEPERKVPFFNGNVISVYNYGNFHRVNGKPVNTKNQTILCARQPNNDDPSKLLVGLCNLPNLFTGKYWIIGYGPKNPPYEWLVVSGGQPHNKYPDGCTTQINKTNNAGLWIFSRTPLMDKTNLESAKLLLKNKGYTLSQLIKVEQDKCNYEDAFIK